MKNSMFRVFLVLAALFVLTAGYLVKLTFFDGAAIVTNPYNPRLNRSDTMVARGKILDKNGVVLAETKDGERVYPLGRAAAHVTGYLGVGKTGMEAQANFLLEATPNQVLSTLKAVMTKTQQPGENVVLTVDATLQQKAYDLLDGRSGAVVMLEPNTGRVLCLVSTPDFDPATVADEWEDLRTSQESPLLNRAVSGLYPPGSTFKAVTALCALRNLPDIENFTIECTGEWTAGGKTIHCFDGEAHGTVNLESAFAQSCNCYFAQLAVQLGAEKLTQTAKSLGFGQSVSFPLGAATPSFSLPEDATESALMETGIGQGQTLVTPLYLAMLSGCIANRGVMMKPYLLDHVETTEGKAFNYTIPEKLSYGITPAEAEKLTELMQGVVESGTGTAAQNGDYSVALKTGTAENPEGADHAWVMGFAPAEEPKVAIALVLEHAGSGSGVVPLAAKMLSAALAEE